MTFSYNTGPGGLMYAPARDFAYNYPQMVACVRNAFNKETWPELLRLLTRYDEAMTGVGHELTYDGYEDRVWASLHEANVKFCAFLNICCQDSNEDFYAVLERSGWPDVPETGKVGWLAMLGLVMMGQLFQGLRDITKEGATAPSCMSELMKSGFDSVKAFNQQTSEEFAENGFRQLTAAVKTLRTAGVQASAIRACFEEAMTT
jgi:hypothetical protein